MTKYKAGKIYRNREYGRVPEKALLTPKDIKEFIYTTINKLDTRDTYFTRKQMMKYFGITADTLSIYLEKGLPWCGKPTRKKFYKNECRSWFFKNGIKVKNG